MSRDILRLALQVASRDFVLFLFLLNFDERLGRLTRARVSRASPAVRRAQLPDLLGD